MSRRNISIAVVDDDLSVRKALARLLEANFFSASTYSSGLDFLDSLKTRNPECLVVDLHMPDYGGLELLHDLRRKGATSPTIVITAHNEIGLRERCSIAGATAFLVKPLADRLLVDAINAAISATCAKSQS
jgi:FixJ family two-component response regulator